jgi:CheY-like chemotaxis protein
MLLEELLVELDCHTVFIASRVDLALARLKEARFDIAVLDVNLGGESSYPVADELNRRNLPFLFATGYGNQAIPEIYHRHIVLQKPFRKQQFEAALLMALKGCPGSVNPV